MTSMSKPAFLSGVDVEFVRAVTFSAAHRYASPTLSEAENKRVYGSLYREDGFGHNFLAEAAFTGPVDFQTGMIANLVEIDRWLKTVAARFDHKFLNECPEFTGVAPTLERLARAFFDGVATAMSAASSAAISNPTPEPIPALRDVRLTRVRIYEGRDTWIDYRG